MGDKRPAGAKTSRMCSHRRRSAAVLNAHGNMSSPSVLFVLEEHLRTYPVPAGDLWLASFGAGFSANACRLTDSGQT